MSSIQGIRDDRLHDGSPTPNIQSSVGIGVGNVSTPLADELALRTTVGPLAMPTFVAGLRGVGRIDADERDPGESGFVFEEGAKLSECPRAAPTTLRPSQPFAGSFPDAFEVFESYAPVGLFRLAHDLLGQDVIRVLLESAFFAGEFLEVALCRFRASCLQLGADTLVASARLLDPLGCMYLTIRVRGNVVYAQVNPEPVFRSAGWRLLDLYRGEQIPLTATVDKVRLAAAGSQQGTGALITDVRDALTGLIGHRPDGHLVFVPAEDTVVVGDGPERPEGSLASLVELVSISDLCEEAYDYLCRKSEALLDRVIRRLLKPVLIAKGALLPSHLRGVVTGFVHTAKCRLQGLVLGPGREQLDHHRKIQAVTMLIGIPDHGSFPVANFGAAPFLPRLKYGGILEQSR